MIAKTTVLVSALLMAGIARADEPRDNDVCLAHSIEGQVLKKDGRLKNAREHLEQCAREPCDESMRARCEQWLQDVNHRLTNVSVRVTDDRGAPLPRAVVRLDTLPIDWNAPIDVDPGAHSLVAEYLNRVARADFMAEPGHHDIALRIDLVDFKMERPLPNGVVVLGVTSAVTFVSTIGFGVAALAIGHDYESCAPYCNPQSRSLLDFMEIASDVSLGLGIASLAAATLVYLLRPSVRRDVRIGAASLQVAF